MVNSLAIQFCGVLIGIFLATLIGAFILKASCALYNLLAGVGVRQPSPTGADEPAPEPIVPSNPEPGLDEEEAPTITETLPGVPLPSFEWAMRIIFFATLVNTSGSFIVLRMVRLTRLTAALGPWGDVLTYVVASPCGILVLGGMCAAMLPTRFGKGLLVSLLFHLLTILIAALLAGAVVLIALAFGFSLPRLV